MRTETGGRIEVVQFHLRICKNRIDLLYVSTVVTLPKPAQSTEGGKVCPKTGSIYLTIPADGLQPTRVSLFQVCSETLQLISLQATVREVLFPSIRAARGLTSESRSTLYLHRKTSTSSSAS